MTTSEAGLTVVGKVMGVYRECALCGDWKLLSHFLVLGPHREVIESLHQCAACRRASKEGPRGGIRPYNK